MKNLSVFAIIAILIMATIPCTAQAPQTGAAQATENGPELTYHLSVMMPQYRFIDTSGYGGRVGEYDSLQQSLGGDVAFDYLAIPQRMTVHYSANFLSRDVFDSKSRITLGRWLDLGMDNRSFVRHLDDNSNFYASTISPDIIRIDSVLPDSLLGIRRRMNTAYAKVQLPQIPVKLFVKGGWQARDGNSQMQYFDMGGSGDPATDQQQGCANCHSASQYRAYNYTTRNFAGGAQVTVGNVMKLTYQHEFRSFNDRMQNPRDLYGTSGEIPPVEDIPYTPAGYYVHSVLPRHETQDDSLQMSLAVAHHVTFNGDLSYARTNNLSASHQQNAFNADGTVTWNPVSRVRVIADFHQQNLLNDWVQTFSLSDPTIIYPYGNPSIHRHWAGVKLAYRASRQFDLETYYKRMNVTRSNASLWPQISSPNNYDPLFVIPASFSNIAGFAARFHTERLWNARAGYEWTGTHDPGYVSDPGTNQRIFGDLTVSPTQWLTFSNDASIMLQQSFPAVQRSNHLYVDTTFLTIKPVPRWNIGAGYTYLQDNLRTDMRFMNDSAIGLYNATLVPYKQLSQNFSVNTNYQIKQRLDFQVTFARSLAHSGFRPDLNPLNYPDFPGAVSVASFPSEAAYAAAFSQALGLASGPVSLMDVPQSIVGSTLNYHLPRGFDAGLRFNYGSYADRMHPDLSGQLRSYTAFMGRIW
ncbi:MAG TPA: hypothetical protein VE377_18015 [Candidatus Dormibacteraeota bacterium]|nr:hypothetical protein [Candidatus Dormibacteraeota bacterium]